MLAWSSPRAHRPAHEGKKPAPQRRSAVGRQSQVACTKRYTDSRGSATCSVWAAYGLPSHRRRAALPVPWGYVDMVLASMRFPDLSLGPYKRDSTTKPFPELRSFVMRESPSLVAPLASWFRTSGRFQRLVSNARVLSGPVRVLVSLGRVLSAPVRILLGSRFQCSGPTPRLSFTLITQCGVGWGV